MLRGRADVEQLDGIDRRRAPGNPCPVGHPRSGVAAMQIINKAKPRGAECLLGQGHKVHIRLHIQPIHHITVRRRGPIDSETIALHDGGAPSSIVNAHYACVARS